MLRKSMAGTISCPTKSSQDSLGISVSASLELYMRRVHLDAAASSGAVASTLRRGVMMFHVSGPLRDRAGRVRIPSRECARGIWGGRGDLSTSEREGARRKCECVYVYRNEGSGTCRRR
jgi:hypothetical protein